MFKLLFTPEAGEVLDDLEASGPEVKLRKVRRAMAKLETDPRHPGLRSHKYVSVPGPNDAPLWESYVENQAPSAWRIWWAYGPENGQITVVTIGPHP